MAEGYLIRMVAQTILSRAGQTRAHSREKPSRLG